MDEEKKRPREESGGISSWEPELGEDVMIRGKVVGREEKLIHSKMVRVKYMVEIPRFGIAPFPIELLKPLR